MGRKTLTAPAASPPDRILTEVGNALSTDPAKVAAAMYGCLIVVGYAQLFGTTSWFGVSAIDLATPSDFLLAGVRNPFVATNAVGAGVGLLEVSHRVRRSPRGLLIVGAIAAVMLLGTFFGSREYR